MRTLLPRAIERLESDLSGDHGHRVALELVRMTGLAEALAQRPEPGMTTPDAIHDDEARRLRESPLDEVLDRLGEGAIAEHEREAARKSLDRKAAALGDDEGPAD